MSDMERGNPIGEAVETIIQLQQENAALRAELARLTAEAKWVRLKLEKPEDCPSHEVYGAMHVLAAHAHGFTKYIEAHKCDDKQGEIARLEHAVFERDATISRLTAEVERLGNHNDELINQNIDLASQLADKSDQLEELRGSL